MAPVGNMFQPSTASGHSPVAAGCGSPLRRNQHQLHGRGSPSASPAGAAAALNAFKNTLIPTAHEFVPALDSRSVTTSASKSSSGTGTYTPELNDVRKGRLIAYQRDRTKAPAVGLVQDPLGKKKWTILTTRNQTISLQESEFAAILPGEGPFTPVQLVEVANEASQHAAATSPTTMKDLWEISECDQAFTLEKLAKEVYGPKATAAMYAATYGLLVDYRKFFKISGRTPVTFKARAKADVDAVNAEEAVERRIEADGAAFKALAKKSSEQAKLGMNAAEIRADLGQSEHADKFAALERLAFRLPDSTETSAAALSASRALAVSATPASAMALLRSCGWWRRHDQVALLQTGVSPHFPSNLQEAALRVGAGAVADADANNRVHMETMHVMTIDDISTTEIDDGLSAEQLPDGSWRVWVHIADPTRWLGPPGSPLEQEAARRCKSVYLPTGVIPMFPHVVAEGCFSLRTGAGPVPAISVSATVGEDGALLDYDVTPSLIEPKARLTYVEADQIISGLDQQGQAGGFGPVPQALAALHKIAQRRKVWRLQQGAVEIHTPDVDVRVNLRDNDEINDISIVTSQQQHSPSGSLVAEMMILANQAIANYGTENDLPLPYRSQKEPSLPSPEYLESLPEGVCRDIAVRNCMTRSLTSVLPGNGHASLGLPAYVQFTSPIRRYSDLLAHYQIKAHVRGQSLPFSADMLTGILDGSMASVKVLALAERTAETYWQTQYFSRQPVDATYGGQFVSWRKQETGTNLDSSYLCLNLTLLLTTKFTPET